MININLTNERIKVEGSNYIKVTTPPLYQYDYGQKLQITGLVSPRLIEVHFCNKKSKEAIVRLGVLKEFVLEVPIPDEMISQPYNFDAFVYQEDGVQGKVIGRFTIPIIPRAKPNDFMKVVTKEEAQILQDAINTLNDFVKTTLTKKTNGAIEYCDKTIKDIMQFYKDGITEEELKEFINSLLPDIPHVKVKKATIDLTKRTNDWWGYTFDTELSTSNKWFIEIIPITKWNSQWTLTIEELNKFVISSPEEISKIEFYYYIIPTDFETKFYVRYE